MIEPRIPVDERERLAELQALHVLDTPPEERFDRITRTAQRLFGVQTALISLIDAERQWFKSKQGLESEETPRKYAFCAHAILDDEVMVIPDAREDQRFSGNPLVLGAPNIRFYAGAPLKGPRGHRVGTLCVLGPDIRTFSLKDQALLRDLANWAEMELSNHELAQALAQLREQEQRKQEFVAMLAHELRTPLTAIRGALGLVNSGAAGELPPKAKTLITTANRNSERLSDLINDFLDLEKIACGNMVFELEPRDLNAVARQAAEDNAAVMNAASITMSLQVASQPVMASVDQKRLAQVLTNLLSNATKFSPPSSRIDLTVRAEGTSAVIRVRDHGPGIPSEFVPRLFQRFAQVNTVENKSQRGTGLGLAICKALMDGMHGQISYRPAEGGGSEFALAFDRL